MSRPPFTSGLTAKQLIRLSDMVNDLYHHGVSRQEIARRVARYLGRRTASWPCLERAFLVSQEEWQSRAG